MIRKLRRLRWVYLVLVLGYGLGGYVSTTYADIVDNLTQTDIYHQNILMYDIRDTGFGCGSGSTTATLTSAQGNASLSLTGDQVAIAKTIIGIAKTENLGQQGALIGLMVALDESGLKDYANSKVPLSLNNPNKQATGSDGYSLGVFQQQITEDWSTISSNINNQLAVNQLMDPAYNAEAFFGSPAGSKAPPELSKGLQNKQGWQTMQPWVAAQAVQASAYADGSNYKGYLADAQQIINTYYTNTPPVALPIPLTGGTTAASSTPATATGCTSSTSLQCSSNPTTAGGKILCAAERYGGIYYEYGGGHQGYAAFKSGCPDPTHPPNNRPSGGPSLDGGQSGNPSPCGIDCSALVSVAVDDAFKQTFDWVVADLTSSSDWKRIPNYAQAQPGDIVTLGAEHVEIFMKYDSSSQMITTFGAHYTGTQTGQTTAGASYYDGIYRYVGPGA